MLQEEMRKLKKKHRIKTKIDKLPAQKSGRKSLTPRNSCYTTEIGIPEASNGT